MTYLAVSISGQNLSQFEQRIAQASQAGAEMLELRVDYLDNLTPEAIPPILAAARQSHLPTILTCRDKAEGGVGTWSQKIRTKIIVEAIKSGVEFVDCEFANFTGPTKAAILDALAARPQTRLILSAHQFEGTFDDLPLLYESIRTTCPQAIPKLIYTARHINDCFAAFDLLKDKDADTITFAMGPAGAVSRILAKKLGAFLTFAALDDQQATAPGQWSVQKLKQSFRWDSINPGTEILGVIGDPVSHSLSPAVFNACFTKDNLNALYLPFWVQDEREGLDAFLDNVLRRPWLNVAGFSVTIPHKTHAINYARNKGDYVEPLAVTIGAANTLKIGCHGIITAYNTDYIGAMDALTEALGIERHQLHSKKAAVIGAGGVSRAVVAGLVDAGAEVTIYNRTESKARHLAEEYRCRSAGLESLASLDADIIINCTSIGMAPNVDASPLPAELFKPHMTAFDTIYTPRETRFLKEAAAAGCRVVNGTEMFIRQAMAQYRIYTGREPDEATIRSVVYS